MSGLEELRKKIYKKDFLQKSRRRPLRLSPEDVSASNAWEKSTDEILYGQSVKKRKIFRYLAAASAFAILAVVGGTVYILWGSGSLVSGRAIDLEIQGPLRINGGDRVSMKVSVANKEKVLLESADLIIEYPLNANLVNPALSSGQSRERHSLGRISPGEARDENFDFFVFGEENTQKIFKVTLEYRMEGSSAIFAKEKEYDLRIAKSAVGVSLVLPEEVKAGQEVSLQLEYVSNSSGIMEDVSVIADYPLDFEFKDSSPSPVSGSNNRWDAGDVAPGSQRTIVIRGILKGDDLEDKIFSASVGRDAGAGEFDVYGRVTAAAALRKPFLDISNIRINRTANPALVAGSRVDAEIFWKNNLPVAVDNMVIEADLGGVAFDPASIFPSRGVYRGEDKKIVWNASLNPAFARVEPGEEGSVSFNFNILKNLPIAGPDDTRFAVSISARSYAGETPVGFGGVDIEGRFSKDFKITTDIQHARKGIYFSGPFENTGPLPPQVGQETTYTIVWSLTNSANDAKDVVLRASLPAYISWKDRVSPVSENIFYNSASGEVVWSIGELKSGTGMIRPAREAAFQIGFVPAPNQAGTSPILVLASVLSGKDVFSEVDLRSSASAITTELSGDPRFQRGQGIIVK